MASTDPGSGSLGALRDANRSLVVEALRGRGVASRTELARLTGLSRTTIRTIVDELRAGGLLLEEEDGGHRERLGRGRPSVFLRFAPAAGVLLGIDLAADRVRVAATDLSSRVLAERSVDAGPAAAATLATEMLERAGLDITQVLAVGVALPAAADRGIGEEMAARLGRPVRVETAANLGALAEQAFGAAPGIEDLIYLEVSLAISGALILGGRLYRGTTGIAGGIAHVQMQRDGPMCRCGNRGCLDTVASATALVRSLRGVHGADLDLQGMLALAGRRDPATLRVLDDAGRMIGRALGDLCNSLNPEAIVVGGDLGGTTPALLDGIRHSLQRRAQRGAAEAVTVVAGRLGERAHVLGAIALAAQGPERP